MYSAEQLEMLRSVDIALLDRAALVELDSLHFDMNASFPERARSILAQVGNPYAFLVGAATVKVEYRDGGRSLADALTSYLTSIRYKP